MTYTPPPGCYGVVSHTTGFVSAAIRLVTRSRYSHAFLVLDQDTVIEAAANGAVISPLTKYTSRPRGAVAYNDDEPLTDEQRAAIVTQARGLKGTPYNYLDIAALLLASLGLHLPAVDRRVARPDRLICSALVDRAYELAGYHLFTDGRRYEQVTPADLAGRITEHVWEHHAA